MFHVDCEWLSCVIFDFVFILFLTTFFLLKYGMTALHRAAGLGFEQIVKILVEHGSNVDLQTSVLIFIFIYFFVFFSFLCCVMLCDIYFVFVLFLTTFFLLKYGMTALHRAAFNGFEQIVKILVEHGSNINIQNKVFFL